MEREKGKEREREGRGERERTGSSRGKPIMPHDAAGFEVCDCKTVPQPWQRPRRAD